MKSRFCFALLTGLAMFAGAAASTPEINNDYSSGTQQSVRLMDILPLGVFANDSAGHTLTYKWTIVNDPTQKAFFGDDLTKQVRPIYTGGRSTFVSFPWIVTETAGNPAPANDAMVGLAVDIDLEIGHADPLQGTETLTRRFQITITGTNHEPVGGITGTLGTPTDRIPTGASVVCSAGTSYDPDPGDSFGMGWNLGSRSGGSLPPGEGIAVVGSNGSLMSFRVPQMTAPIDQIVNLHLIDGLHHVVKSVTTYLKPATSTPPPVTGNTAPQVTVSQTSLSKKVGENYTLSGFVQDNDGDTCSVTWMQNGATVQGAIVTPVSVTAPAKKWSTSYSGVAVLGTHTFRLTGRETSTNDHKSAYKEVTLYVTSGSSLPPDNVNNTPDSCTGNTPPTVTISPDPNAMALVYTGGEQVSIVVTGKDSTTVDSSLGTITGIKSITWDLSQLGVSVSAPPRIVDSSDATLARSTLKFTAPDEDSTRLVTVRAEDQKLCGRTIQFTIHFQKSGTANNQSPTASFKYKVTSGGTWTAAPTSPVTVESPKTGTKTIYLDGNDSTDDGGLAGLTFLWSKVDSLTKGSVTLSSTSSKTPSLSVAAGTVGSILVKLQVTDQANASNIKEMTFSLVEQADPPVADAVAKVDGTVLNAAVGEGATVNLDGSNSENSAGLKTGLSYLWEQVSGQNVTLQNADSAVASFVVPAVTDETVPLVFKLTVTDTSNSLTDDDEVTINLLGPGIYFAQVGVGAISVDEELRTVLLLVNNGAGDATGTTVEFFGSDGQPFTPLINGQPWNGEPFEIRSQSSRRLIFTPDAGQVAVGWARVKSSAPLTGLAQYQIFRSNEVQSEVSVFASNQGTRFATYFNPQEHTAIAVANPTEQKSAAVRFKILDYPGGQLWEVLSKSLFPEVVGGRLEPMEHRAKFIDSPFLGEIPAGFEEGTMIVECDTPIIVTVLKTKEGVPFSSLPLATAR